MECKLHSKLIVHTNNLVSRSVGGGTSNCLHAFSYKLQVRVGLHKVPSHLRLINAILVVENMAIGIYYFTLGPESYVPSMTWMPTWQHILEARLGTYVLRVGLSKKLTQLSTQAL